MRIPGLSGKSSDSDWAKDITDHITQLVDSVHDKAVVPLTTVVRAIVYGLLAAVVGISALVLLIVSIVRLADVYLDNIPGLPDGVWVAYLVSGAIFVIAGLLLWMKRSPRSN